MGKFTILNSANCPINVRVSNAGITYFFKNDIPPGATYEFTEMAAVWYDITAYYSSETTKIDPGRDNVAPIGTITSTVLGILGMVAGVVLIAVPGGQPAAALVLPTAVSMVTGVLLTTGSVILTILDYSFTPVGLSDMYGAHEYTVQVSGGMNIGVDPTDPNRFVITQAQPIRMAWNNKIRNTSGEVAGAVMPTGGKMPPVSATRGKRDLTGGAAAVFVDVALPAS